MTSSFVNNINVKGNTEKEVNWYGLVSVYSSAVSSSTNIMQTEKKYGFGLKKTRGQSK